MIHIAAPDLNTFRHLQRNGGIQVWASHRTNAKVTLRVRLANKDPKTMKLEAGFDEIAPGWEYVKEKP